MLFLWIVLDTRKHGQIRFFGLCAITGLSIWWQELYADWGGCLLWSDSFLKMPWAESLSTTPDKPWFLLASYPVFMCVSISLMLWLYQQVITLFPKLDYRVLAFVTASLALIAINTLIDMPQFLRRGSGRMLM